MKFPLNRFRNLSNGFVKENAPHFFLIFERENIAIGASGECFLKDRVTSETRCSVKGNQVYVETITNRFRMHMTLSSDVFTLCEILQKLGCPVNNITKRNEGMNPVSVTANAPPNRNLTQGSDSFFSDSSFSQHSQNTEYSHSARSSQSSQSERLSSEYSFSQSSTRSSAADDFDSIFAEERNCDARNPRIENGRGRVEPMDTQEMFSQSLYNAPTQPAAGLQLERYLTLPGERKPSFGSQDPFSQSQNSGHHPFNNVPQRSVVNTRLPTLNSQPTRTKMPNDREFGMPFRSTQGFEVSAVDERFTSSSVRNANSQPIISCSANPAILSRQSPMMNTNRNNGGFIGCSNLDREGAQGGVASPLLSCSSDPMLPQVTQVASSLPRMFSDENMQGSGQVSPMNNSFASLDKSTDVLNESIASRSSAFSIKKDESFTSRLAAGGYSKMREPDPVNSVPIRSNIADAEEPREVEHAGSEDTNLRDVLTVLGHYFESQFMDLTTYETITEAESREKWKHFEADGNLKLEKINLADMYSDPHLFGRALKQMMANEDFMSLVDKLEELLTNMNEPEALLANFASNADRLSITLNNGTEERALSGEKSHPNQDLAPKKRTLEHALQEQMPGFSPNANVPSQVSADSVALPSSQQSQSVSASQSSQSVPFKPSFKPSFKVKPKKN